MSNTQAPMPRSPRMLGGRYSQYDEPREVKQSRTAEKAQWRREEPCDERQDD